MIEDKKLGVKIAESDEEAAWITIKENCEKDNKGMLRAIEMYKAQIILAENKIKEMNKHKGKYIG